MRCPNCGWPGQRPDYPCFVCNEPTPSTDPYGDEVPSTDPEHPPAVAIERRMIIADGVRIERGEVL